LDPRSQPARRALIRGVAAIAGAVGSTVALYKKGIFSGDSV
jgi:hypothetical protein